MSNMYRTDSGWNFARYEDGGVMVIPAKTGARITVLDKEEWAEIVAFASEPMEEEEVDDTEYPVWVDGKPVEEE